MDVEKRGDYVLALDLGTSGPKVALVSSDGSIAAMAFEPVDLDLFEHGGASQDPDQWWGAFVKGARRVIAQAGIAPESIAAVCCSAQWSGTVAVDKDGRHLLPAMIWLDSRGAVYADRLIGGFLRIQGYSPKKLFKWISLTGGAPGRSGKDPIAHILYIKNKHPDIYEKTACFLEPKDYMNYRLTGRFCATWDSITLHWITDNRDINDIRYDDGLISMAGIDAAKLPELARSVDVIGGVTRGCAEEIGILADTPVIGGTPDVQAAAIGSGGVEDFASHLYIGTSSWLTCHVPFKKTDLLRGIASLPSAVPGRYFVANEQETAGACLNYLKDNIFFADDGLCECRSENVYADFDRIAADVPPGSRGVLFTPWLYGERTPIDDPHVRAVFFNQSLSTTRADLVRAVLEGVAFNGRWLLEGVERFVGKKLDPVRMIGGGALSGLWCRIHADVWNRKILQMDDPISANVRGAGLLGFAALGRLDFSDIAKLVPVAQVHEPGVEYRDLYDERYDIFKKIYFKNKRLFRRLNAST